MIGEIGEALTPIVPPLEGKVRTHGEIWDATANEVIAQGDRVAVRAVQGLKLMVGRLEGSQGARK